LSGSTSPLRSDFAPSVGPAEHTPFAVPRPLMSVIVPVHNKASELSQCLAALAECRGQECELIVVDDQSTENVREVATRFRARYFCTPRRGGPALARNVGAKHALGGILLFVDADVVVPPGTLDLVRRCFAEDSDLVALFGSYDDEPACTDFYSTFKNLMHHHVHQSSNSDAVTFWAGCGAIRTEAFQALRGFDTEKYPMSSIEDIELGMRLVKNKQKIRLVKELQVKHLKRWSPGKLWQTDIFRRAVPWSRLILETHSVPNDLNLTWKSRTSACLVATLVVLLGSPVVHLAGLPMWRTRLVGGLVALNIFLLMFLNRGLYGFFCRKRGLRFAIGATLMHWLYLFYSGTTFSLCWIAEPFRMGLRSASPDLTLEHSRHDPQ